MRGMREVEVTPTAAGRFEAVIGGDRFTQFSQLADATRARFLGRSIWNINAVGLGGVAEMLRGLVATGMGLGVDTRWLMIDGDAGFFAITKRIHNCVRGWPGDGGPLGDAEPHAGRYQSAQHLGDAAETDGVDVPNAAAEEAIVGGIGQQGELGEAVAADDGFEPAGSSGGDLDFAHAAHLVLTAAAQVSR